MKLVVLPVVLVLGSLLFACAKKPEPEHVPAGSKVELVVMGNPKGFVLGPKSAKLFIDMLATRPVHSSISEMPAAPIGRFTVDGKQYLWHGNAVIHGTGPEERLWSGPYLQRLVNGFGHWYRSTDETQKALDAVENDPTVEGTPIEGPGAYPGGGDALHPIR